VCDGLNLRKNNKVWFCAYKAKKDLLFWVNLEDLKYVVNTLNMKIFKITVKEYQIGKDQAIYLKESILKKEDITNKIIK
jgi:hypothetical protein